jgi:hypothetical protein
MKLRIRWNGTGIQTGTSLQANALADAGRRDDQERSPCQVPLCKVQCREELIRIFARPGGSTVPFA